MQKESDKSTKKFQKTTTSSSIKIKKSPKRSFKKGNSLKVLKNVGKGFIFVCKILGDILEVLA